MTIAMEAMEDVQYTFTSTYAQPTYHSTFPLPAFAALAVPAQPSAYARAPDPELTVTLETDYLPDHHSWVMLKDPLKHSTAYSIPPPSKPFSPSPSAVSPTPTTTLSRTLDHTAYPHILKQVLAIAYASAHLPTLLAFRLTSRGTRSAVDRILAAHLRLTAVEDVTYPQGGSALPRPRTVVSTPLGRYPSLNIIDKHKEVADAFAHMRILDVASPCHTYRLAVGAYMTMPGRKTVRWIDDLSFQSAVSTVRLGFDVEGVMFLHYPAYVSDLILASLNRGALRPASWSPPMLAMSRALGAASLTLHIGLTDYGLRLWRPQSDAYCATVCPRLKNVTVILDPVALPVGLASVAEHIGLIRPAVQDLLGGIVWDIGQTCHTVHWTLISLEDVRRRRFDPAQHAPASAVRKRISGVAASWRNLCRQAQPTLGEGEEVKEKWKDGAQTWAEGWAGMSDDEIEARIALNVSFKSGTQFQAEVGGHRFALYTDREGGWGSARSARPPIACTAGQW